jgi:hypothetical protein
MDITQTIDLAEWWKLLEQYYADYGEMVRRSARRITGNDYDAEDVAQTIFMRLLHRETCEGIGENPGGYEPPCFLGARVHKSLLRYHKL